MPRRVASAIRHHRGYLLAGLVLAGLPDYAPCIRNPDQQDQQQLNSSTSREDRPSDGFLAIQLPKISSIQASALLEDSSLASQSVELPLVPFPKSVKVLGGSWRLSHGMVLRAPTTSPLPAVDALMAAFPQLRREGVAAGVGASFANVTGKPDIDLSLDESLPGGNEAYKLTVAPGGPVSIQAAAPAGLFYGVQTLLQLSRSKSNPVAQQEVPAVEISDAPRFGWRGIMVDTSRHFFAPKDIKRLIGVMASLKYNKFHWHLTDDQGWRLQVARRPLLTEVGSGLKEAKNRYTGNAERPDQPYYSLQEIKDVVSHAANLHVDVIPEVDMPGHTTAAIVSYPELGNDDVPGWAPKDRVPVERFYGEDNVWGVYGDTLQPSDKSVSFISDVMETVHDAFPSKMIHIGGDEAPSGQWKQSPRAQGLLAADSNVSGYAQSFLALDHKTYQSYQSFFTAAICDKLHEQGRTAVAWDEVLTLGGAPKDMVIAAWRSRDELVKSLNMGHPTINAVQDHLYFDRKQSHNPAEPHAFGDQVTTLEHVYKNDPALGLTDSQQVNLLGAQAQLWSEWIRNATQLEYMAHPRSFALAEVTWSSQDFVQRQGAFSNFDQRLRRRLVDLDIAQVNYRHRDMLDA